MRCLTIAAVLVSCSGDKEHALDSVASDTAAATARMMVLNGGAPDFPPRDEAGPSFREFRTQALDALARKDTAFLYAMIAPEIRNSFGDDYGLDGFKRIWKMHRSESAVWTALSRVLQLGGDQTSDSSFVAPYVYAFWPDSIDSFEHVAIVDSTAVVFDAPRLDASSPGIVKRGILRVAQWSRIPEHGVPDDSTWVRVQLPSGGFGWVKGMAVYSPVGWRAAFYRRGGQWRMIFFVAGD
jgi:hypothetical protein